MTNNSSTHNTLIRRAMSKIAPPNFYRSIRYNLLLLPIAVMAFIAVTALSSCQQESDMPYLEDVEALYMESCGLKMVSSDSIQRFANKFETYVNNHRDIYKTSDYYDIVDNIEFAAKLRGLIIVITINDVWDGDTTIYF